MKRRLLLCTLALCLLLSACAQPKTQTPPKPADEIAKAVEAGQTFEEMTALNESQIVNYLGLDTSLLSDMAMYIDASRATAEMIIVLTAKDQEALEQAASALTAYRDATLAQYRDYRPEEAPKLEAAVMKTTGLQTVLIVSPDAAIAEESLKNAQEGS